MFQIKCFECISGSEKNCVFILSPARFYRTSPFNMLAFYKTTKKAVQFFCLIDTTNAHVEVVGVRMSCLIAQYRLYYRKFLII